MENPAKTVSESGSDRSKRNRRTKLPPERFSEPAPEIPAPPSPSPPSPDFYIEFVWIKKYPEVKKEPIDDLIIPPLIEPDAACAIKILNNPVANGSIAAVEIPVKQRVSSAKLFEPPAVLEGLKAVYNDEEFLSLPFVKLEQHEARECVLTVAAEVMSLLPSSQCAVRQTFGNPTTLVRKIQERRNASQLLKSAAPHTFADSIMKIVIKMFNEECEDNSAGDRIFTWEAFFDGAINCEAVVVADYLSQIRQEMSKARAVVSLVTPVGAEETLNTTLSKNKLDGSSTSACLNEISYANNVQIMMVRDEVQTNGKCAGKFLFVDYVIDKCAKSRYLVCENFVYVCSSFRSAVTASLTSTNVPLLSPCSTPSTLSSTSAFLVPLSALTTKLARLSPLDRSSSVSDSSTAASVSKQSDVLAAQACSSSTHESVENSQNQRRSDATAASPVVSSTSALLIPQLTLDKLTQADIPRLDLPKRVEILSEAYEFLSAYAANPPDSPLSISFEFLATKMPQFLPDDIEEVLKASVVDFEISRWKLHFSAGAKKLVCMAYFDDDKSNGLTQRQRIIQSIKKTPRTTPANSPPQQPQSGLPDATTPPVMPVSPTSLTQSLLVESRKRSIAQVENNASLPGAKNEQQKKTDSVPGHHVDAAVDAVNKNLSDSALTNSNPEKPSPSSSLPSFSRDQDLELFDIISKYESTLVGKGQILTDYHIKGAAENVAKQPVDLEKAVQWVQQIVRNFRVIRSTIELSFNLVDIRRFDTGEASSTNSRFLGEIIRSNQRSALKVNGFQQVQSALRVFRVDKSYIDKVRNVYDAIDLALLPKTASSISAVTTAISAEHWRHVAADAGKRSRAHYKSTNGRYGRKRSASGHASTTSSNVPVGLISIGGSPNKRNALSLHAADDVLPLRSSRVPLDDDVFGKSSRPVAGVGRSMQKPPNSSSSTQHSSTNNNNAGAKRKQKPANPSTSSAKSASNKWLASFNKLAGNADRRVSLPAAPNLNKSPVPYITARLSNCCLTIQENAAYV